MQSTIGKIVGLWLAWLLIILGYQAAVTARYQVQRPDQVLPWTASLTHEQSLAARPYLAESGMLPQVAWDSEFYLSIALRGYDDPLVRAIPPDAQAQPPFDRPLSLNYAFFPVYPVLMRLIALPLSSLGLDAVTTATVAGVLISALGTLLGMIALYDLVYPQLGQETGWRSIFYLISFPTGFFLAQVYTEGLFIALSFGCLALVQRKQWLAAGSLAAIATLTRAVGVVLLVPLLLTWFKDWRSKQGSWRHLSLLDLLPLAAVLLPLITHLIWRFSFFGQAFRVVEDRFFHCRLLDLPAAASAWSNAFAALFADNPAAIVHYGIEFAAILLGLTTCLLTLKRYPGLSIYGLAIIAVSTTCGTTWSISRYLLTVPSIFIVLGHLGRSPLFDRIWSLTSILLLAMLTALFSFDFWAG